MANAKTNAIKACDQAFSVFVRKRGMDKWGMIECATCGYRGCLERMTCGHLFPRYNMSTRWHEKNALPQCWLCQTSLNGEREKMKLAIDKEFGAGTAEEMRIKSYEIKEWTKEEIKALTKELKAKSSQDSQRRNMD